MYLKEEYNKLNNSFTNTLIFRIGDSGGFFSEYNIMIFAMLYCLNYGIKFKLYSKNANFSKGGLGDFFLPFGGEVDNAIQQYFNYRPKNGKDWLSKLIKEREFWRLKYFVYENSFSLIYKKYCGFNYYTQDVWPSLFKTEMKKREYHIPELGIDGGILEACNRLINLTWHFNSKTEKDIYKIIHELNLPSEYISCQIRGGDKIQEYDLLPVELYIEKLNELDFVKDVFVLTDDYRIIEKLKLLCPERNWHTLCDNSERGYNNQTFLKKTEEFKRMKLLRLFSSIELMKYSKLFIGTKTTNPGIFMDMAVPDKCCFVDTDEHPLYGYFND